MIRKILLFVVVLLPLSPCVSTAGEPLVVDSQSPTSTRASLSQAPNGVPLVNIATPSARGVSHNQFSRYNVEQQGLILNNSSRITQSQLGGFIDGNPHLTGDSARLILNEVTGSGISTLNGCTEVAGQAADLVLANPNGIQVNGGGFINTPRVTLTTGVPQFKDGNLSNYRVERGQVEIAGLGLNAANVDAFDIIARAVKINADLWAGNLNLVTGSNRVEAQTLDPTPLIGVDAAPQFALDSTALGGMYADRIHLIGTEAGVGVRIAGDMATTTAGIQIDLNGDLKLIDQGSLLSAGTTNLNVQGLQTEPDSQIFSSGDLRLGATKDLMNRGEIIALGQTDLETENLTNEGLIFSGKDLNLKVDGFLLNQTSDAANPEASIANIYAIDDINISGIKKAPVLLVENASATIESRNGSIAIDAGDIFNHRRYFAKTVEPLSSSSYTLRYQKIPVDEQIGIDQSLINSYRALGYNVSIKTETFGSGDNGSYGTRLIYALEIANRYPEEVQRELTITEGEEKISQDSIASGIFAGQDIHLTAENITNSISQISAGRDVNLTVSGALLNQGESLSFIRKQTGRYKYCYKTCNPWPLQHKKFTWAPLPITQEERVLEQMFSSITAGGTVSVSGAQHVENGRFENAAFYSGGGSPAKAESVISNQQDSLAANNRLFTFKAGSDHPYLVETRPEFTDFKTFISSDYLLSRLGYAPEQITKRLGDGFYETERVRASLLQQTGKRFLEAGITDDQAQYQRLMDNALMEASALELVPGIALTSNQVATLGRDIVWMVESEVNGEKVLTPKVYLSELTRDKLEQSGSTISGTRIHTDLNGVLHNYGSLNAIEDLLLSSEGSIENHGGTISGGNVALNSENGDIVIDRLTQEINKGDATASLEQTLTGDAGSLLSRGDLSLKAKNIRLSGSEITAAGTASLIADESVKVSSTEERIKHHAEADWGYSRTSKVRQQGSNINANDLILSAADNISIEGSTLKSRGDTLIVGTGDINIAAVDESNSISSRQEKSGVFSSSLTEDIESRSWLKQSRIETAGSLLIDNSSATPTTSGSNNQLAGVDADITQYASTLTAGQDILLSSKGKLNILSGSEKSSSYHEKAESSMGLFIGSGDLDFWRSNSVIKQNQKATNKSSSVSSGGNILITSAEDVNLIGSSLQADKSLEIHSTRDTNLMAAAETDFSETVTEEKRVGFSVSADSNQAGAFAGYEQKKNSQRENSRLSAASQAVAGADLKISAGQDILQVGSQLEAGRDAELQAEGDIRSLAAVNSSSIKDYHELLQVGLSSGMSYNFGQAADSVKAVGDSGNALTAASRGLRAIDAIDNATQPSINIFLGAKGSSNSSFSSETQAAVSSISASRDLSADASGDIEMEGSQLASGRDLDLVAENVRLRAARGSSTNSSFQGNWQAGITVKSSQSTASVGGGFSLSGAEQESQASLVTATTLHSGKNLSVVARTDMTMEGTQAIAAENLRLEAGSNLDIHAAQGSQSFSSNSHQAGAELGLSVSAETNGYYLSANAARSQLDRNGSTSTLADITAGHHLQLTSGKDTQLRGGKIKGKTVSADVGGDLLIASLADSGKTEGDQWSAGGTISTGGSVGINASIGKTSGSRNWVDEQTSITAEENLAIDVAGHTQLDAAVIASESGDLRLETGTFAFSDLNGHDKETSVSAGFGISKGPGTGKHSNAGSDLTGSNWSAEGGYSNKNRQQILRATIGDGTIIVREDTETGKDSTQGLNRNLDKAYEITKDESSDYELYASANSLKAVKDPLQKAEQWRYAALNYGHEATKAVKNLDSITKESELADFIVGIVDQDIIGLAPSRKAHGGLATLVPNLLWGGDKQKIAYQARKADDLYVKEHPNEFMPASELPYYDELEQPGKDKLAGIMVSREPVEITKGNATYQNFIDGMNNSLAASIVNGIEQTGSEVVTIGYNPNNGLLGDLLECSVDKLFGNKWIHTGQSKQAGIFQTDVILSRKDLGSNFVEHSQANLLVNASLAAMPKNTFDFLTPEQKRKVSYFSNGSPVKNSTMKKNIEKFNFIYAGSNSNSGDLVSEILGGNKGLYDPNISKKIPSNEFLNSDQRVSDQVENAFLLFSGDKYPELKNGKQINKTSPHSLYECTVNCSEKSQWEKTP